MIKYDLHLLGWHSFQQLCLSICRQILGQTVENFLDTNDAGKDGAFSGIWRSKKGEDLSGKFIIQCKYSAKKDYNINLSMLADEFEKIEKLVSSGQCDSYILITNHGVSGAFDVKFKKKITELGVKSTRIFGSDWITEQITNCRELRMMVPRIYGLGDLSVILDERAFSQARQLLLSMRDDLAKIVITSAYRKAAKAINKHGFVLIVGEPAAGKTTIASLLAMGAVDLWSASTIKIERPSQIIEHWNPDDPNRFIWIDDAFGVTQYEQGLVSSWNHIIPQIKTMLDQGVKIVMTSRDYIYNAARNDLKEGAFPLFNESQVVIDVQNLELVEKEQILYNHLKLGKQDRAFLKGIKPFLSNIANSERFIPETARRLADPAFTTKLDLDETSLINFVSKQESLLQEIILCLDKDSKAALGLIYMKGGVLPSPFYPNEAEIKTLERMGSNVGKCVQSFEILKGSFLQYLIIDDEAVWKYKHPTIGDAYAKIISESREQLEIYLHGTETEEIMEKVTCGDVGLEKATIIPRSMYPLLLKKLLNYQTSSQYKSPYLSRWGAARNLNIFLSRRCTAEFIKLFIDRNPVFLSRLLTPTPSFDYNHEINLIIKLNELEILSENDRKIFVDYVTEVALRGDDLYVLESDEMQSVFNTEEIKILKDRIRNELLPNLKDVFYNWQSDYSHSDDNTAEEYMDGFLNIINILSSEFEHEQLILKDINIVEIMTKEWINEKDEDTIQKVRKPARKITTSSNMSTMEFSRSIFDDIDS